MGQMKVRQVQVGPAQSLRELSHGQVAHGNGQEAEYHPSQQIGGQDGFKHVKGLVETCPREESLQPDLMPVDAMEIYVAAMAQQNVAHQGAGGGDGDHGPRIINECRNEHQWAVEATKEDAKQEHQAGM